MTYTVFGGTINPTLLSLIAFCIDILMLVFSYSSYFTTARFTNGFPNFRNVNVGIFCFTWPSNCSAKECVVDSLILRVQYVVYMYT